MDAVDGATGAGEISSPPVGKGSREDKRWEKDRVDAEHTRLARIQASANVWLGILGTLFGLSGAVVLIKGSTAFATWTHNAWLHWGLLVMVGLPFAVGLLPFTMAGVATWGGLA